MIRAYSPIDYKVSKKEKQEYSHIPASLCSIAPHFVC